MRHPAGVAATDALWGGIVQGLRVDVTARTVELEVRIEGPETAVWQLGLAGVAELRVDRPDTNSWDYTELTEVHVDEGADGRHRVELIFWDEPNGLLAVCDAITVSRV